MLNYLTLILILQLVGEFVARISGLPLPGPVIGMGLLFVFLLLRSRGAENDVPEGLGQVADGLLAHLSLLFVPAGVGVMVHAELLQRDFLPLMTALVISTILTLIITAHLMVFLQNTMSSGDDQDAEDPRNG